MTGGLLFRRGGIICVDGKEPGQPGRTVLTDEQVDAIRMIVRDEIERHEDETAKFIDKSHEAGFDQYNGI